MEKLLKRRGGRSHVVLALPLEDPNPIWRMSLGPSLMMELPTARGLVVQYCDVCQTED